MKDCDKNLRWWQGSQHEWAYRENSGVRECIKCKTKELLWCSYPGEDGPVEDWRLLKDVSTLAKVYTKEDK